MRAITLISMALMTGAATKAEAFVTFLDGNKVYQACVLSGRTVGNPDPMAVGMIVGIWDGAETMRDLYKQPTDVCLPDHMRGSQIAAVVCTYLDKNPAIRHERAATLVVQAVQQAFTCPGD